MDKITLLNHPVDVLCDNVSEYDKGYTLVLSALKSLGFCKGFQDFFVGLLFCRIAFLLEFF